MSQEEIFEKIRQLVFDENKIVTIKYLSQVTNMNISSAKVYLNSFYNSQTQNESSVGAFFVVIGLQDDDQQLKSARVQLIPADDLPKVKSSFKTITSSHIYCIHKGKLIDKNALYTADFGMPNRSCFPSRLCMIRNTNVKVQTADVLRTIEIKDERKVHPESKKSETPKKAESPKKAPTTKNKSPDIFSLLQKKSEYTKAREGITQESQNGMSSANKKTEQKVTGKSEGKKNDVLNMFSRQAEKNASKPVTVKKPAEIETVARKMETSSKANDKKQPISRLSRKSKRMDDGDSGTSCKQSQKHRRIMTAVDSDSESENEEAEDKAKRSMCETVTAPASSTLNDDEEEDDEEPIPPTPPVSAGKVKKWKFISKTFQDSDGFLVTKSSKEYVTASEESDVEEPIKECKMPAPRKETVNKAIFANKKQSALTSFFKQK